MRTVFFSFDYADRFRVNQVREHRYFKKNEYQSGYYDGSIWEDYKTYNPTIIRRKINSALQGTQITVVLIGAKTSFRPWVKYEIKKSLEQRNGLLGIYIHNCTDYYRPNRQGNNPFYYLRCHVPSHKHYGERLSNYIPIYDWVNDDGFNNFKHWIEDTAKAVGL